MRTYVLLRFEHVDKPLSWWRRLLGQKHVTSWLEWRDMRREVLCSVRANSFTDAASKFGGNVYTMGFSPTPFAAENAKYQVFVAGPDTFKIVIGTYDLLGRPEDVRDAESFESHTRIHLKKVPLTTPFNSLFRAAHRSKIMDLEKDVSRALTDIKDGRARLFLMQVPEVQPTVRNSTTAHLN